MKVVISNYTISNLNITKDKIYPILAKSENFIKIKNDIDKSLHFQIKSFYQIFSPLSERE